MSKFFVIGGLAVIALVAQSSLAAFQQDGGIDGGGGGVPPTISFTASPAAITAGQTVTLTWSSNASYCWGENFSASTVSGSTTVTPAATTTYTIYCYDMYDTGNSESRTVTVTAPTGVDLTAGTPSVNSGTLYTGNSLTFAGTVTNNGSTNSSATFSNRFQIDLNGDGSYDTNLDATNSIVAINGLQTKTAVSPAWSATAGTHKIRLCVDSPTSAVTETNEGNNCGADFTFTVSAPPAPVITISTNPTALTSGQSATLTWSATNASSCTGTNFSTGNAVSGSVSVSPTSQTMYSVSCTGTGGTSSNSTTLVVGSGSTTTTVNNAVCSGGSVVGTYSNSVNTCTSYCSSLGASCCTVQTFNDQMGDNTYTCTARTGTTQTTSQSPTNNCQNVGGEPMCTSNHWTSYVTFNGPAVTASLVTNPTSMSAGQSAVITWSSENATTCTGTGFSTGNATSGSVTVSPTVTTTYSLSCTGPGGTASNSKTLTVNQFTVTCSASPSPATVNAPVTWSSTVVGGLGTYSYSWTGSESLSGTSGAVSKTYTTLGDKQATLSVTSGAQTITTACSGYACQNANCTCTGIGCGVVVQEGTATDITATVPTIAVGNPVPGQSLSFSGVIQNIGNNSINSVFGNRFQIDVGSDGTYDVNLDLASSGGSQFNLGYGQQCTGGSTVYSDYTDLYGSADVSDTIQSMCESNSSSGQCCSAIVTQGSTGGGGGGGGCPGCNLAKKLFGTNVAQAYKKIALSYSTITLTVRSGAWSLASCSSGTCYGGSWGAASGQQYSLPLSGSVAISSPTWANIPGGTHKVRLCTDHNSQLYEVNDGNNCGPDLSFTVSGYDFTAGTTSVATGSLVTNQPVTFTGGVSNAPTSYVASGQCQATVVVIGTGACALAVNRDRIQWSTTGATMVNTINALTSSPTVPATGAGGAVSENHTEGEFFTSQAIKQDMLANGGVNFSETTFVGRTAAADQTTMNRVCQLLTGKSNATASSWGVRNYSSCGNNSVLKFNGTVWSNPQECPHLSATMTCQYPGSPYALSGTYFFPTPLTTGTHTYQLTSNHSTTNTCTASITVPPTNALCSLQANPSIVTAGSATSLSWSTSGASSFFIDQGLGTVTPTGSGSRSVSPTVTTTYTGTATTDVSIFNFVGTLSNRFELDLSNDGIWDTNLDATGSIIDLNVSQTKMVTSPTWSAQTGTHKIRLCANTPASVTEGDSANNCGPAYTFSVVAPQPPTASLTASSTTVVSGNSTTLTWSSTNATSCTGTNFSTGSAVSGTASVSPTSNTTYTVTCNGAGGSASQNVSITVTTPAPTATISASPSTIVSGNSSTLTWSSTNATSCTGTNFSTGGAASSSVAVSPTSNTTYSVSCTGPGGTANNSTTVTVSAGTFDLTANTPSLASGSLATGVAVSFRGNITNGGTGSTSSTFSNRFQIDIGNNSSSSWDVNLVATSSVVGIAAGQSKQVTSPNWTAVVGTHEIRLCADAPTSAVTESNESNNCGPSWIFTVSAAPNTPFISGPTTGFTNSSLTFSFQGTDPASTTLRYGIDWDNNSVVDEYAPTSGYVASGIFQDRNRSWSTTGSKTLRALSQNSLGANSGWRNHTLTISNAPPPPPVALITVTPSSITAGATTTITWSSSNATSCTGTNFSTGNATSGSVSSSALFANQTYTVNCTGPTAPADSDSATVTVTAAVDLTAGVPGLNSGYLYDGAPLTFWANVTNDGTGDTSATFSNRFQIDLNANGSWDVNRDATDSITALNAAQTKQVTSPSWTAVQGTHRVRLCADSPTSGVAESDETNNCSASVFTFTVTAAPECADGVDNNGNGSIDYPTDHACSNYDDPTEEVLPSSLLSLAAFTTGAEVVAPGVVQEGTAATLRWTVTDVLPGSCTLEGTNGDAWNLTGTEGAQVSSPISGFTTFRLECTDLNDDMVYIEAEVRTAPAYEEI